MFYDVGDIVTVTYADESILQKWNIDRAFKYDSVTSKDANDKIALYGGNDITAEIVKVDDCGDTATPYKIRISGVDIFWISALNIDGIDRKKQLNLEVAI